MSPSLHEQIISETRAVQETLARLGLTAASEEIQRFLASEGLEISLLFIEKVRCHPDDIGLFHFQQERLS